MSFLRRRFRRGETPPPAQPTGDPSRVTEVERVLAEMRPMFALDGGDMRLVSVDEAGWVTVRTHGACHGCAVSGLTLQGALAPKLRERCPWFAGVRSE